MQCKLSPGRYLLAVSGGVDSVVLLDLVAQQVPPADLIVAHLDHGIHPTSAQTATFVAQLAGNYGLSLVRQRVELGPGASEDTARQARYTFLYDHHQRQQTTAILLAHHQDDVLETAIFNLVRGTGRRGLTSLGNRPPLLRPLLDYPKQDLLAYARKNKLAWREDPTNADLKYQRNYLRQVIVPKFSLAQRQRFLTLITQLRQVNQQLDNRLANYLEHWSYRGELTVFPRRWFNSLPHQLAQEVVHWWLVKGQVTNPSRNQIDYIVVKLKTLTSGKQVVVGVDQSIQVTKRSLRLCLGDD